MKNIKKIFGIIALVTVIALSFASCDLGDEGDDGVQKILVVTDLPADFNGKLITVAIVNPKNNNVEIVALDQLTATSTTVTSQLTSGKKKGGAAYTGTGDYFIYLFIDTKTTPDDLNDDDTYFYVAQEGGAIAKPKSITTETTTVSFKVFKKKDTQ